MAQQLLRAGRLQRHVAVTEVAHIMRALPILQHVTPARAAEGLDRVKLAFFHAGGVTVRHDGDGLAAVDLVRRDGVAVQVAAALDRVDGAVDVDLVGLHHLLDGLADLCELHVNAGELQASVGGLLDRVQQGIELGVEGHGEGAVDDAASDLRAEVDLHDVAVLQHCVVSHIRGIVRGHVVDRAARGERNAGIETVLLDELAVHLLDLLAHVHELDSRLDNALREVAHLSVHFRCVSDVLVQGRLSALLLSLLLLALSDPAGSGIRVLGLSMRQDFASRKASVGEQLSNGLRGRIRLPQSNIVISETSEVANVLLLSRCNTRSLLLLGGFLFLLFLLATLRGHAAVHAILLTILVVALIVLLINDLGRGLRFSIKRELVSELFVNQTRHPMYSALI
eukprot:Colp12_sorted_trinity150504_noHs@1692